MRRYIACTACVFMLCANLAMAAGGGKKNGGSGDSEEKIVSGMSIVGNNETPKSLVIVPWKGSEIGQETKLKSNLLDDNMTPVDRAVFMRELDFYKLANPK